MDAAALVRRGMQVTAADASPTMVAATRVRLAAATAGLPSESVGWTPDVIRCRWLDLPRVVGVDRFDAVLCLGSSLAHARPAERPAVLAAFRSVLRPGGTFIMDTREWESLHPPMTLVDPTPVTRDGRRALRSYHWRQDGPDTVELTAELDLGDERRALRVRQHPFTRRQLRDDLATAGFGAIALDHVPQSDRYTATARRPG